MLLNKELTRLGETTPREVNFRIIAASNKELEDEVKSRRFRDDLYYRLKVIKFVLPPLRERKDDIPLLAEHFAKVYSPDEGELPDDVLQSFLNHDWPGNVRELKSEIKRILALGEKEFELENQGINSVREMDKSSLASKLAHYEREQIIQALREAKGIKVKAAKLLRIPWTTLNNKIKKYNIESPN